MGTHRHIISISAKALAAVSATLAIALVGTHISVVEPAKPVGTVPENPVSSSPLVSPGFVVANDEADDSAFAISQPPSDAIAVVRDSQPFEPDIIATPADTYVTIDDTEYPLREYRTAAMSTDPEADQWWVRQTELPAAWDTPRGETETLLAVIDGGIALGHEEFSSRIATNSGESGITDSENPSLFNCTDRGLPINATCNRIDDDLDGIVDNELSQDVGYENVSQRNCTDQGLPLDKQCNLVDDDYNGYIDDYRGYDFINDDRSVQAGENNPDGFGVSHASAVASVAAADGENGVGIAGVDWATKILPIQAIDDDDNGHTLSVGRAIYYAAEMGADVINLSLGGQGHDPYVREAIRAAIRSGAVVVAASGNDGCNCVSYPARYPEVVAVGALNETNERANFSSYGSSLDVVAPGTNMKTAGWSSDYQTNGYLSGMSGTSFATPVVSGLLSRIKSQQPDATPLQLIAAVTETVNRLSMSTSTVRTDALGFGGILASQTTNRMGAPTISMQLNALVPMQAGAYLTKTDPLEKTSTLRSILCIGQLATTPVYELTKTGDRFFTVSYSEVVYAVASGYTVTFFGYSCITQPHDTAGSVREIDVFGEFRNTLPRYRYAN